MQVGQLAYFVGGNRCYDPGVPVQVINWAILYYNFQYFNDYRSSKFRLASSSISSLRVPLSPNPFPTLVDLPLETHSEAWDFPLPHAGMLTVYIWCEVRSSAPNPC